MKIAGEIARTIHQLRRMPSIDIERLSYELSPDEWIEFNKELTTHGPADRDLSYADKCLFMGLTVRKRSDNGTVG